MLALSEPVKSPELLGELGEPLLPLKPLTAGLKLGRPFWSPSNEIRRAASVRCASSAACLGDGEEASGSDMFE